MEYTLFVRTGNLFGYVVMDGEPYVHVRLENGVTHTIKVTELRNQYTIIGD